MQESSNEKKIFCNVITSIISANDNLKKDKSKYPNISFDISSSYQIINKVKTILNLEPAVLQINTKSKENEFIVVGDIHGSVDSIIRIFKEKGYPPNTRYLFLGDFVDRGRFSCEVMMLLYGLKCLFPSDIYFIRGNHEFSEMSDFYGFKHECINRIKDKNPNSSLTFYNSVLESFTMLPICAILNDTIFCVHGGISTLIKNRQKLLKLKKVGRSFSSLDFAQEQMLWNDPDKNVSGFQDSPRGRGFIFGDEAIKDFLHNLNFSLIIRGHQDAVKGFDYPFGQQGGILTVFSSIDYLKLKNNGAVAVVLRDNDDQLVDIEIFKKYPKFDAANHVFTYHVKKRSNH